MSSQVGEHSEQQKLTIAERSQTSKQNYSSVEDSSHGSPLSSSFCEIRSQKLRRLVNEMDKAGPFAFPPSHPKANVSCSVSEITLSSDRERLKLLNKLCKTCSRHRVIPKSMHIPDCSKGCCGSRTRGLCRCIAGYIPGASGGHQGRARVHHQ
jgi:hypothetical protein